MERTWEIDVRGLPTFTDALQKFERESGIQLRGIDCAMAFAGAVAGEQLSLARSRWTITRAGITAVFGKEVDIINTIAARAWAVKSGTGDVETIRGVGSPNLGRAGRYAMVLVDQGVGAAIIDVDRDGSVKILETEAGHTDFPATSEQELKLANALKGTRQQASWEQMLKAEVQAPEFAQTYGGLSEAERLRIPARTLGRFCVNLMHVYGAWHGIMITGGRGGKILQSGERFAFDAAFKERSRFSRLVEACPVWKVEQRNAVLQGAAECLAHKFNPSIRHAA
ncbi:MAG: glucokinase [Sphingomicrobium sp.]